MSYRMQLIHMFRGYFKNRSNNIYPSPEWMCLPGKVFLPD